MADRTIPYLDAGKAAFEQLDTYMSTFLTMGDYPPLQSTPIEMASGASFEQFEVVSRNGSGLLVAATAGTPGFGVITQAASHSGQAGAINKVPVWWSGFFNIDALTWGVSFTTDALKLAAFEGADTPTQIMLGKR